MKGQQRLDMVPLVQDCGGALTPLAFRFICKQSQWAISCSRPDGLVQGDLLAVHQETQLWLHVLKLSASKMTSECLFPFVVMIRSLGKQHSAVGAHSPGRQRLWQAFCAHGLRRLIPVTTPVPSWPVIRTPNDVHEWFGFS